VLRRTLAAVVALAGSAALAAPASAVVADHRAMTDLLTPTPASYGAGYSPAVQQEDGYYPEHGDPRIDVLTYDLSLRWDPTSRKLTGTAKLHFRAVQTSPQFQLDLAQPMAVSALQFSGGLNPTPPYTHDGKDLVVTPAAPIEAGQTYDVTVTYAGTPKPVGAPSSRVDMTGLGWHTAKDGQTWTMQEPYGAYTWYPVNDMPADKAIYSVSLDVPDPWVGISNGTMSSRRDVAGRTLTTFKNTHPMASYLTTVAIGPYRKATQTGPHDLPMTYWYPKGHPEMVDPLKTLPGAMTWLEHKLGPYPFERVGVVLTPSESAMETPTMITMGAKNFRYGNRDVRETVVHELIHAWYGDTVTPTDWSDVWMNEGMAMYLEARYSVYKGWKPWQHWSREFNRNDGYWREIYGPPGAYKKREFAQINVYYCTARMLLRLRRIIGDTAFDAAVRDWPQANKDKGRGRDAYVSWLESRTHKKLKAFFDTELDDAKPTQ